MKLTQFILCALIYQASYQAVVKERILFGYAVTEGQIPYHVQLGILKTTIIGGNKTGECGGSLVSSKHVLTAEHCLVKDGLPVAVAMAFGSNVSKRIELYNALETCSSPDKNIQVCRDCWINSPFYDPLLLMGDIAIINLPQTVEFTATIQPVKLPSWSDRKLVLPGKTALATGWGKTDNNLFLNTLLITNFIIEDYSTCQALFIPEDHFCALRGSSNELTTCNGDSGGPVVVDNKQVGITSYGWSSPGDKICFSNSISAYTNVIYYLEWISHNTDIKIDE